MQIGQSVGQVDNSTQQNAAAAEETAGTASTLMEQADHLQSAIGKLEYLISG